MIFSESVGSGASLSAERAGQKWSVNGQKATNQWFVAFFIARKSCFQDFKSTGKDKVSLLNRYLFPTGVITDAASTAAIEGIKKLIGLPDGIAPLDTAGFVPMANIRATANCVVFFNGIISGVEASEYDTTSPSTSSGGGGIATLPDGSRPTVETTFLAAGIYYDRHADRMLIQELSLSILRPGAYYYWKAGCTDRPSSNARLFAEVMAPGGKPRSGVLYIDTSTGLIYRYDGTALVHIGCQWTSRNICRTISLADFNDLLSMRPLAMRVDGDSQMWRIVENDAIIASAEWYSRYSPDDGECLGGELRVRGYGIVSGDGMHFAYDPQGDGGAYREWSVVDAEDHWEDPVEVTPLTPRDRMSTQTVKDMWKLYS